MTARVQNKGNHAEATTNVSATMDSNVAVGNLIVIKGMKYDPSSNPFVLADCTKTGGTATLGTIAFHGIGPEIDYEESGTAFAAVGCWSAIVTGAGSLTMNVGGATGTAGGSYLLIDVAEYSPTSGFVWDASRAEDTAESTTATDGTTPATSTNLTSAGAALFTGCMALGIGGSPSAISITEDAAFTLNYEDTATTDMNGSSIYKIVGSGNTDACEWAISVTGGTNEGWAAEGTVFKETASATTYNRTYAASSLQAVHRAGFYRHRQPEIMIPTIQELMRFNHAR